MAAGIEVSFEDRVPVVGQILILEALDFIYSVVALGESRFMAPPAPSVDELAINAPGKLLPKEDVLTVEYVRNGSVKEVLSGVSMALHKTVDLIRWFAANIQLKGAPARIDFVRNELLPTISALKKQGLSEKAAERLIRKAAMYLEDVLGELARQQKLKVDTVGGLISSRNPCPTCNGVGLV